jgi:hypothetical protein
LVYAKSSGGFLSVQWGLATDTLVPGDYDGDGKTDIAVYRLGPAFNFPVTPANYIWYIRRSSDNTFIARQWGTNVFIEWDTPTPADFDGDGITDLAVYTLSDGIGGAGRFKLLKSSDSAVNIVEWGRNTDLRIPADYDGDGKADPAVYRGNLFGGAGGPEINLWYILNSSTGTVRIERFGLTTDNRVPADYDGDGKTDLAVWRSSDGFWYRINSRDNSFSAIQFGVSGDYPFLPIMMATAKPMSRFSDLRRVFGICNVQSPALPRCSSAWRMIFRYPLLLLANQFAETKWNDNSLKIKKPE